jgi:hypothetical protein
MLDEYFSIHARISRGGDWLASARSWMQSNIPGGDRLTWGSGECVRIPFCKLEELAKDVAIAAIIEDRKELREELVQMRNKMSDDQKWHDISRDELRFYQNINYDTRILYSRKETL